MYSTPEKVQRFFYYIMEMDGGITGSFLVRFLFVTLWNGYHSLPLLG